MFEASVHVVFGKAVAESVAIHLFPFVIELRKIHHHIALCAVQLGC